MSLHSAVYALVVVHATIGMDCIGLTVHDSISRDSSSPEVSDVVSGPGQSDPGPGHHVDQVRHSVDVTGQLKRRVAVTWLAVTQQLTSPSITTDSTDSADCLPILPSKSVFYFFYFLVFHFSPLFLVFTFVR